MLKKIDKFLEKNPETIYLKIIVKILNILNFIKCKNSHIHTEIVFQFSRLKIQNDKNIDKLVIFYFIFL